MEKQRTGLSTLIVMVGTAISRLLGFARMAVISAVFGGGAVADVLSAVFMIPNNLRKLLAEGALSTAFVPTFTKTMKEDPSKKLSSSLVGSVISFQTWILVPLLAICFIFAEPLASLLFPFQNAPIVVDLGNGEEITVNKAIMSVQLFPWMMQYLLFVSFSAIFMAVLNVHGKFTLTSLAPLMFSLSVIMVLIILNRNLFIWAQVLGVLLGGILQLGILTLGYKQLGYKFQFMIAFWRHPEFKNLMGLLIPVLGSSAIFTLTETLATAFAAAMPTGSTSAIANAVIFWQLPYGIFSASISTVLFPKFASLIAEKQHLELGKSLGHGLRTISYLLIPSMILLIVFGNGIIAAGLQRGRFTAENTELTALVLGGYALGMLPMGMVALLQRYFFAANHRRIPFIATVIIAIADVILSIIALILEIGPLGLALANSIASGLGALWLVKQAQNNLQVKVKFGLGKSISFALVASIPMVVLSVATYYVLDSWWIEGSTFKTWGILLGLISLGGLGVLGLYKVFKIDEIFSILRRGGKHE